MAERRIPRAQQRSRINMGEPSEIAYWAKSLGVTKERLIEAIEKVGDDVQAVRREVGERR